MTIFIEDVQGVSLLGEIHRMGWGWDRGGTNIRRRNDATEGFATYARR